MKLTLKCGECGSTMTLDFKTLSNSAQQRKITFSCQACNEKFNDTIAYELLELIREYQKCKTKWEFEFKLTPPPKDAQI